MMNIALVWLYGWGVVMCAGLNKYVEAVSGSDDPKARWTGAIFWPVVVPFVIVRRLIITVQNRNRAESAE